MADASALVTERAVGSHPPFYRMTFFLGSSREVCMKNDKFRVKSKKINLAFFIWYFPCFDLFCVILGLRSFYSLATLLQKLVPKVQSNKGGINLKILITSKTLLHQKYCVFFRVRVLDFRKLWFVKLNVFVLPNNLNHFQRSSYFTIVRFLYQITFK